jgi:hypothetical protein
MQNDFRNCVIGDVLLLSTLWIAKSTLSLRRFRRKTVHSAPQVLMKKSLFRKRASSLSSNFSPALHAAVGCAQGVAVHRVVLHSRTTTRRAQATLRHQASNHPPCVRNVSQCACLCTCACHQFISSWSANISHAASTINSPATI